jgi:hypothetical protein
VIAGKAEFRLAQSIATFGRSVRIRAAMKSSSNGATHNGTSCLRQLSLKGGLPLLMPLLIPITQHPIAESPHEVTSHDRAGEGQPTHQVVIPTEGMPDEFVERAHAIIRGVTDSDGNTQNTKTFN